MSGHGGSTDWKWPLSGNAGERAGRLPLMRLISYSLSVDADDSAPDRKETAEIEEPGGTALSMNLSAGGMLVIMRAAPAHQQVVRLGVPTPVDDVATPTLAEVRWSRKLPFPAPHSLYLVGLKFIV